MDAAPRRPFLDIINRSCEQCQSPLSTPVYSGWRMLPRVCIAMACGCMPRLRVLGKCYRCHCLSARQHHTARILCACGCHASCHAQHRVQAAAPPLVSGSNCQNRAVTCKVSDPVMSQISRGWCAGVYTCIVCLDRRQGSRREGAQAPRQQAYG